MLSAAEYEKRKFERLAKEAESQFSRLKSVVPAEEGLKTLRKSRKLVARKNGWTQGHMAVVSRSIVFKRISYCSLGAIRRADGNGEELAKAALTVIANGKGFDGIIDFNDDMDTKQEDVIAAFDEAIELLEKA